MGTKKLTDMDDYFKKVNISFDVETPMTFKSSQEHSSPTETTPAPKKKLQLGGKSAGDYSFKIDMSPSKGIIFDKSHSTSNTQTVPKKEVSYKVVWTKFEARVLISYLQDWSRLFNYHVCLGGSVLNFESSEKDLDIYFLPLSNGKKNKPIALLKQLQFRLNATLETLGNDYPTKNIPYIFKGKLLYKGAKRIDVFVLGSLEEAETISSDSWKINLVTSPSDCHEIAIDNITHFKKEKKDA